MKKTSRLLALLILAASSHALAEGTSVYYNGQRVSLEANKAPINKVKNPDAIAQLPTGHHFVVPGAFTVAVAAQNSPPLTVCSDDKKNLLGSEVEIAGRVAGSLG